MSDETLTLGEAAENLAMAKKKAYRVVSEGQLLSFIETSSSCNVVIQCRIPLFYESFD